jgi:3-hydroxyacyl-CoA dehydrogenase/enoyl-CoA hydratase/3-hydroxybutyryl-CoA epimerase/enoyl-CoA isomerase
MIFHAKTLQVKEISDGIYEILFRAPTSANILDMTTLKSLRKAIHNIKNIEGLKGVVLSSSKQHFMLGADIYEFLDVFSQPSQNISEWLELAHSTFSELETLDVPTVCALNGYVLGGGLELALSCDFRIATSNTQLRFPETTLGIIPGYGGCVRATRLLGIENAFDIIAHAKMLTSDQSLALGMIDSITSPQQLKDAALQSAVHAAQQPAWLNKRRAIKRNKPLISSLEKDMSLFALKNGLETRVSAHSKIYHHLIDVISASTELSFSEASAAEIKHFVALATSKDTRLLVCAQLNDQEQKRRIKQSKQQVRELARCACITPVNDTSLLLSQHSVTNHVPVLLKDSEKPTLKMAVQQLSQRIKQQCEQRNLDLDNLSRAIASIRPTINYSGIEFANIVVEATRFNPRAKLQRLKELQQVIHSPNTQLISINDGEATQPLSDALKQPLIGLHLSHLNNQPAIAEIACSHDVNNEAKLRVSEYLFRLGYHPIAINDDKGSFVQRVITKLMIAFSSWVKEGADAERIDDIMEHELGWQVGPGKLADEIGLDTLYHWIKQSSHNDLSDKGPIAELYGKRMLGKKSLHGFYQYDKTLKVLQANPLISQTYDGDNTYLHPIDHEHAFDRLVMPVINEALSCLSEKVINKASDGDFMLIHALGFPRSLGGAFIYLDTIGIETYQKHLLSSGTMPPKALAQYHAKNMHFYQQDTGVAPC